MEPLSERPYHYLSDLLRGCPGRLFQEGIDWFLQAKMKAEALGKNRCLRGTVNVLIKLLGGAGPAIMWRPG